MLFRSGYLYPHDYPEGVVKQEYLPANVAKQKFYHPTNRGYEKEIIEYLKRIAAVTGKSEE